jgi:phosphate transport system permease protein
MALTIPSRSETVRANVERALMGKRRDVGGAVFLAATLACLLVALLILITLIWDVLGDALPVFEQRGWSFVTSEYRTKPDQAGIYAGLWGSIWIVVFVVLLAFPVGIAAGIYLEDYAPRTRLTRFIQINIRNLAGVPSVVYGILGYVIFVKSLRSITGGPSVMAAGITMAVLVLPVIIITTSEAVRAVPQGLREAGYGVGATRWEVTRDHVLPYAAPGILTGTVLAIARALGEAAPLILVGAVIGKVSNPQGSLIDQLQGRFTAMPAQIFDWAGNAPVRNSELQWPAATAAEIVVLLALVLLANAAAIVMRNHFEKKRVG